MGKRRLLICFAVITMLITGCGEKPVVLSLELPDKYLLLKLQP